MEKERNSGRRIDRHTDRRTDMTDGQADRWTDGQTDRETEGDRERPSSLVVSSPYGTGPLKSMTILARCFHSLVSSRGSKLPNSHRAAQKHDHGQDVLQFRAGGTLLCSMSAPFVVVSAPNATGPLKSMTLLARYFTIWFPHC